MLPGRVLKTWMLVIAASLAIGPVAALATGPSAGDNQYTDPLASTKPAKTSTTSTTPAPTTTTPAQTVAPATTTPAPSSSAPAATTTSPASTTAAADPSHKLPTTGYDAWLGALLGVGLVVIGFGVRRAFVPARLRS